MSGMVAIRAYGEVAHFPADEADEMYTKHVAELSRLYPMTAGIVTGVNEALRAELNDSRELGTHHLRQIQDLRARVAELEAALRFYADGQNHLPAIGSRIYFDAGYRAREVLKGTP